MQKVFFSFLFLVGFMFIQSSASAQTALTENKVANDFLTMLDGTEATAEKAVATYGSKEVIANGMIPFGKSPKITKVEDNCIWFSIFDEDNEKNDYSICTEGDKIISFDFE